MTAGSHRSIGEVLNLLRDEFPDITISKIRFLESQGLLDPERTPSGYRRFYDHDIERLRWILRQQRENFLPLKVIRGRLAEGDPAPGATREGRDTGPAVAGREASPGEGSEGRRSSGRRRGGSGRGARSERAGEGRVLPEPSLFSRPEPTIDPGHLTGDSGVSMTLDELMAAAGLSRGAISELERYGLVGHRQIGTSAVYDEDALLVARLAAAFAAHGLGARHLRMYKVAADREAGMLEQIVAPLARQRGPQARQRVAETVAELSRLGADLHAVMLRQALKNLT